MKGWTGRILHIDLATGKHRIENPDREVYRKFLGGKGLAGHYLRPYCTLDWDHPDMPVIILTGPLTATIAPTSGRSTIMSRSPLTGAVADSSVGGRLGTEIKRAGLDGLIITGKSDKPCGIEITGRKVTVTDAARLWGETTTHAFDLLTGKGSMVAIGPAAENGVLFSCVSVDRHHAAGRSGLGLCFAAKNLKYLTIMGMDKTPVHDREMLKAAREDIMRLTHASPILMGQQGFACFGTGSLYDLMDTRRMMPTDNFSRTRFKDALSLNAHAYKEKYSPDNYGCKGCHIQCKKISNGTAMPEFETMSHFTALVGNTDMSLVVRANELCNQLGMDTISAASTLACMREIRGRDFKPRELLATLENIGLGREPELAQGSLRYASSKGRPELSMSAKGLELAAYDPRGACGMALGYALSTRGGCHLRAYPVSHEILRKPVATDRFSFSAKPRAIKIAEDQNAAVDSLIACKFIFLAAGLEEYAKAYTAVTGQPSSAQELSEIGESIYYHERIMNAENGFTAEDDDLPERFFTEPGSSGKGFEVPPLDRGEFLIARATYYRIRGLDQNGLPRRETAERLGLEWNG